MKKTLKELKVEFSHFIENINANLNRAKEMLKVNEITFSYDEIDNLKDLYENNYQNPEKINSSYEELADIFHAYVGEAFMFYNGGNWELAKYKKDEAYGTPIILNWGKDGFSHASISPYIWRILIERKLFRGTMSEKIKAAQIPR